MQDDVKAPPPTQALPEEEIQENSSVEQAIPKQSAPNQENIKTDADDKPKQEAPKKQHAEHHLVPVILALIILIVMAGIAIAAGM
ncbi:MAG TPA: hypothetical protein VD947_00205 [Patescibacteria group bacterium]|nr:hypothetical protein [Patescibacteria group bacterium]